MYLFAKSMAFFWTLAEASILLFMRWGTLRAEKGNGRQSGFIAASIGVLALLGVLLFFGESFLGLIVDLESRFPRTLYRWALWNFFCTLWVILEGSITLYVWRIWRVLRDAQATRYAITRGPAGTKPVGGWGTPVLAGAFLLLYFFYQAALFQLAGDPGLTIREVVRISQFYIRICGIFWIAFEWVVAIQGIRAYRLLKRMGETAHGNH